jgi:hypothetical protein
MKGALVLLAVVLCAQLGGSLAARVHKDHRHVIRSERGEGDALATAEQFHDGAAVASGDDKRSKGGLFGEGDVHAFAEAISRRLQQEDDYPYKKEDWLRLAQMVFEEAEDRLTAPHYVKEVAARVGCWEAAQPAPRESSCAPHLLLPMAPGRSRRTRHASCGHGNDAPQAAAQPLPPPG